ncbi:NlpC/P60 family protein [Sutcliffiella horikoshii]|uniref:NlpC/P60 family protein n=1 Tax=Sutcliffiella horikoshii TaxID=79883 RepID=A0A5D4T3G9_9BACI|nr:C40 family peptidase [Sutcliffiella horikoshii]TYS68694.1 NlpC/P60 family protein [Sutcliffiella horikoshii]
MSKYVINVPVATIWTSYNSPRKLDEKATSNPTDIKSWLDSLNFETRLELCDDNLIQSQLLFGQEVLVLEEKENYYHIIALTQGSSKDQRGYPGWVPKCQITEVLNWKLTESSVAVVTSNLAPLYSKTEKELLELSFQTILPVVEKGEGSVKVQLPDGEFGVLRSDDTSIYDGLVSIPKGSGADIVQTGERFLGLPYLWGGMSGYGMDCSGFSYTMCKANGYTIPRDAHDQAKEGLEVPLDALEPGDLLFFAYEEGKGKLHHVGIYHGDGKLLHSPKTGRDIEILPMKNTIYEKELCAARRYWQKDGE